MGKQQPLRIRTSKKDVLRKEISGIAFLAVLFSICMLLIVTNQIDGLGMRMTALFILQVAMILGYYTLKDYKDWKFYGEVITELDVCPILIGSEMKWRVTLSDMSTTITRLNGVICCERLSWVEVEDEGRKLEAKQLWKTDVIAEGEREQKRTVFNFSAETQDGMPESQKIDMEPFSKLNLENPTEGVRWTLTINNSGPVEVVKHTYEIPFVAA